MESKPIVLQIRPRGKPIKALPESVDLEANATTADLFAELARRTGYSVYQLRLTKGSDGSVLPNSKDVSIHNTGLRDRSTIYVKDLGPQVAWRTVFVVEYLGPLLIHPLIYALRPYIYPSAPKDASQLQTLLCWLISLHFVKRELETIFVHRFSSATMPLRNIFKNSFHYWVLSGVMVAAFIYAPSSATAREANPLLLYPGLVLYTLGELGNLQTHLTLRGLRSSGGTERGIPQGPLFNLVTCPNYLTETISWIGVYLISGLSWGVLIFLLVSVAQMAQWAKKKEQRYRKEFGDKYKKKRYTMLPGIW
ncbi:3-oxo-5a-steroid 4- dehydrogenase [Exophiala dermatitidis]|uniref:very-long-chain enoyl-CoA reductase n=2 Tax=Exophiala dermatitidis TaxID=5970 RepID=H6C4S3_EXODN